MREFQGILSFVLIKKFAFNRGGVNVLVEMYGNSMEVVLSLDSLLIDRTNALDVTADIVVDSTVRGCIQFIQSSSDISQLLGTRNFPLSNIFETPEPSNSKRKMSPLFKPKPLKDARTVKTSPTQITTFAVQPSPSVDVSSLRRVLVDEQTREKIYQCTFCNYETKFSITIKRHIEMKHLPQTISYNCLQCSATFKAKQSLKGHYMRVHGLLEPAARAMLPA